MPMNVLFVVTSHGELGATGRKTGWYSSEVSHPLQVVVEAGGRVDFASPQGGAAPMDPGSADYDDPVNAAFLRDAGYQNALRNTLAADAVEPQGYEAIFFAGGHGTMWDFPGCAALARAAVQIYEAGGVVAAVCHGPSALINMQRADGSYLVAGHEVAGFSNAEERAVGLATVVPFLLADKLQDRGARYTHAANFEPHVVVSERLLTGQNPASAKGVGQAMVTVLRDLGCG